MSDLIKKSDAIKALYKYTFVSKNVIEREINAIPSADRPTGEWIKSNILPNGWNCDNCGSPIMTDDISEMLYCPNCGAKMGGEEE